MAATILVCRCGRRISAPGAVPGRVGRCPACGAALRIPAASDAAAPPSDPAAASGGLLAERAPPAGPRPRRKPQARKKKHVDLIERLEGWEGLVRRPELSEAGFWNGLAYPLWGANGLAFLLIFPIMWWLIALPTFDYAGAVVRGESEMMGPPIKYLIPSLIGWFIASGYTLAYLSAVFLASAAGDLRHPRWPDLEPWELARTVIRWAWALSAGLLAGGTTAWLFLSSSKAPQLLDWVAAGSLLAMGALYAEGAFMAVLLFDDLTAANPITVGLSVWRTGPRFLRPLAFVVAAGASIGGLLWAVFHITNPYMAVGAWLLFWWGALYAALTAMHELGLEYQRNARRLGWFREDRRVSS